ncbi:MAG TPA: ABC transporter substrate-binding protein, partial [Pseudonocardiaceae bacterium]|nr:ABC transporter substrate-binding protein [Pseudonocardiaceae bacterium]
DVAFVGSGPLFNAYSQSDGGVKLVAGASSGGAELVVQKDINAPADLRGKAVSDPQPGNTQDVSLRTWLAKNNLTGQVTVDSVANSTTLTEFKKGDIQGAWVPEPYASQLVLNDGGKVLVDEKSLWPNGEFPTTVVLVRKQFLEQHPATVTALLKGEQDAINYAAGDKAGAEAAVNDQLKKLTGATLSQPVIDRAFSELTLTLDPLASDFPTLAQDQVTAGISSSAPNINGIADLTLVNQILTAAGKPAVSAGGLGS